MPGPRRDLEQDADALERVARIADYFVGLAYQADDKSHAEAVKAEAECFRRWEKMLREIKSDVHPQHMKDGS